MNSWLFLNSGPGDAAFNMALDETLLEALPRLGQPVLRCYGWTEPAATFGYFQKYAEIERVSLLRPLIRRPTGGGLVPHDADWTYSLAFPTTHEWYSLRAEESYRRAHAWIQAAFALLGVETELAPCCKKAPPHPRSGRREEAHASSAECGVRSTDSSQSLLTSPATDFLPGQCFVGHEKSDVLWHGKKIAGAAQRRNKLGLLIQGSVQPPPLGLVRADWEHALCKAVTGPAGTGLFPDNHADNLLLQMQQKVVAAGSGHATSALWARATELAAKKYALATYNQKR